MSSERENAMDERWHDMKSAPKDGSRILATIGAAEQGSAEVDVVYWAQADAFGIEGWRAADSHPGNIVGYADSELKCWMPMPDANTDRSAAGEAAERPKPWGGEDAEELFGSGI